jgi:hypothetical protein
MKEDSSETLVSPLKALSINDGVATSPGKKGYIPGMHTPLRSAGSATNLSPANASARTLFTNQLGTTTKSSTNASSSRSISMYQPPPPAAGRGVSVQQSQQLQPQQQRQLSQTRRSPSPSFAALKLASTPPSTTANSQLFDIHRDNGETSSEKQLRLRQFSGESDDEADMP